MNFVGLDVHKKFTYGVVKNEQGKVLNQARFDNSEENFDSFLQGFKPEETKIVMESTGVWEYIYDILERKSYEIKLANPVRTKAIASARIKTDAIDASTLADLLRLNSVSESYVPSKEMRRLRNVVRQRKTIVKGKTQMANKIHSILIRHGIKLPYETLCESALSWVMEEIETKDLNIKRILISYISLLEQYKHELKIVGEKVKDLAEKDKQAQLLMTIPGVGSIRAMEILTEIADINRFPNSSKLCSYAGLVPSVKQSGSTLRFGRLIQQSSKSLKNTMIEVAWIAIRKENQFQFFYKRLQKKKGKQKAICAVARKMLCAVYAILKKQEEFMIL